MPLQDPIQDLFSSKLKDHASEVPHHVWSGIAQSLVPKPWWKSWWAAATGTAAVVAAVGIAVVSNTPENHNAPSPTAAVLEQSTPPMAKEDSVAALRTETPPPPPGAGWCVSEVTTCCVANTEPLVAIPEALVPHEQQVDGQFAVSGDTASAPTTGSNGESTEQRSAQTNTPSAEEKQWKLNHNVIDARQLLFYFFHSDEHAGTYQWDFGDGTTEESKDVMHTFDQEGTYTVTLTKISADGHREKSITQEVEAYRPVELKLPTVFTPNEDSRNDVFSIGDESTGVKEVQQIVILTRDGQEVMRTNGTPWNGKWWNGEEALSGVYVYVIRISGTNGKISEHSGTVQLLR